MNAHRVWRVELPPEPDGVTAVKDRDGDLWLLVGRTEHGGGKWGIRGSGPWSTWTDMLEYAPLTEVPDPRT